ncbi:Single-strand annealing protein SAK3 [uncultured Caudovirales phage]|uniref:Single-strand annealing protein SAK3 n=1 Tax=uncultured Caudovirales phage TaxID=2100421 RepID=A0A6J5MYS8_9CAUD|nr:Single-strand annealing protein SAK3 [uncultured Caudovirales phage]
MKTFADLRTINVNEYTKNKGKFTYLSWVWAVDQLLQLDPTATWEYKDPVYFAETLMVFCSVTAFGKTMTAQLPVMDYQNKAIQNPDAFAVNKAMQRVLAKAIALHGLGLYIFANEDIPEEEAVDLTENADKWVGAISRAETMEQLKAAYQSAYVELQKDKSAVQLIANAKDAKKAELTK